LTGVSGTIGKEVLKQLYENNELYEITVFDKGTSQTIKKLRDYKNGILDKYLFDNLEQVRILTYEWIWRYNTIRTHDSLLDLTPRQFLLKYGKVGDFPTFQQDISMYNEYEKSIFLSVAI